MCEPKRKRGLGFKELQNFNMVLIAKQGWRIIKQPNSLFARAFRGKYFHSTSFLQAKQESNPL